MVILEQPATESAAAAITQTAIVLVIFIISYLLYQNYSISTAPRGNRDVPDGHTRRLTIKYFIPQG
jgi:hypothetical protein